MSTTAAAVLRQGIATLRAAGIEDAPGDARRLLAAALGIGSDRLTLVLPEPVPPSAQEAFAHHVAARAARRPVARILGRRSFFGRDFRITDEVLDPRPETECLVSLALGGPFEAVIDLGTGSGCILLSLLGARPVATGLGTDLSPGALAVAGANAADHGLAPRARWLRSDWWGEVRGRFDLVVSNPPYVAAEELSGLAPEVADHDPAIALSPGGDGLDAYRAIAAGARDHLAPGGRLLVEIGWRQGVAVAEMFRAAGFASVAVHPDLDRKDRVVSAFLAE